MRLYEFASAVIFVGVLSSNVTLSRTAEEALQQLARHGYQTPTSDSPVKVTQFTHSAPNHAAGWKPGNIFLRAPSTFNEGSVPAQTQIVSAFRHELMHEAISRTCQNSPLKEWENEAAAIAFEGGEQFPDAHASAEELKTLSREISLKGLLTPKSYHTLKKLVMQYGWPETPCSKSPEILEVLAASNPPQAPESYVLMNVITAEVPEQKGDSQSEFPVGSLLKIPFVASLTDNMQLTEAASIRNVSEALLRSDTQFFSSLRGNLNLTRFKDLILKNNLESSTPTPVLLGEENLSDVPTLRFTLSEIARAVRNALLLRPDQFTLLANHHADSNATLFRADKSLVDFLRNNGIGAKTGSVTSSAGHPEQGYVATFWPAHDPKLLAVYRVQGLRGKEVAEQVFPTIKKLFNDYPSAEQIVKVPFLSQLPSESYSKEPFGIPDCTALPTGGGAEFSTCGSWIIRTSAKNALTERLIRGVIAPSGDSKNSTLLTSSAHYSKSVAWSEGDALPTEALKALMGIAWWNGVHGFQKHRDSQLRLCDTTHCMVYRGEPVQGLPARYQTISHSKIQQLGMLAGDRYRLPWIQFSTGGTETWCNTRSQESIASALHEEVVLSIVRERKSDGQVVVRVHYGDADEALPCDRFFTSVNLPGCPERIEIDGGGWRFCGVGKGNSSGFSLLKMAELARSGVKAEGIVGR